MKYFKWANFLTSEVNMLRNADIESWLTTGDNDWLEKKLEFKKYSGQMHELEQKMRDKKCVKCGRHKDTNMLHQLCMGCLIEIQQPRKQ